MSKPPRKANKTADELKRKRTAGGVRKPASKSALRSKKNEGLKGEYFEANREAGFGKIQRRRERRNRRGGILFARRVEQTPFGPVSARDIEAESVEGTRKKVQLIGTNLKTYKGSDRRIKYAIYQSFAPHIDERVARMILIELLETTIWNSGQHPEGDKERNERCQKRQAVYSGEDVTTRRIMAMTYALALFSEEQRTGAGKAIRAGLLEIVAGKASAEQVFVGDILESAKKILLTGDKREIDKLKKDWGRLYKDAGPRVVQLGKGGMEQHRMYVGGGERATEDQMELEEDYSVSSDDEERSPPARRTLLAKLIADHNEEENKKAFAALKRRSKGTGGKPTLIHSDVPDIPDAPDRSAIRSVHQLKNPRRSRTDFASGLKR